MSRFIDGFVDVFKIMYSKLLSGEFEIFGIEPYGLGVIFGATIMGVSVYYIVYGLLLLIGKLSDR